MSSKAAMYVQDAPGQPWRKVREEKRDIGHIEARDTAEAHPVPKGGRIGWMWARSDPYRFPDELASDPENERKWLPLIVPDVSC